jgi:antitoxin VapB
MSTTRAFKSGNSQAVRIPADLAFEDPSVDLTITRTGDVITIYPARGDLRHAVELLRAMPKPPNIEQREPIELPDRDGA